MSRYVLNDKYVLSKVGKESVIAPIAEGVAQMKSLLTLNETGTRILELIQDGRSTSEVFEVVKLEYEVDERTLQTDIASLVSQLLQKKILLPVD